MHKLHDWTRNVLLTGLPACKRCSYAYLRRPHVCACDPKKHQPRALAPTAAKPILVTSFWHCLAAVGRAPHNTWPVPATWHERYAAASALALERAVSLAGGDLARVSHSTWMEAVQPCQAVQAYRRMTMHAESAWLYCSRWAHGQAICIARCACTMHHGDQAIGFMALHFYPLTAFFILCEMTL